MSNLKNSWPMFLGFIAIGVIVGVVLTSGLDIDSKSYADKDSQSGSTPNNPIYLWKTIRNPWTLVHSVRTRLLSRWLKK